MTRLGASRRSSVPGEGEAQHRDLLAVQVAEVLLQLLDYTPTLSSLTSITAASSWKW